MFDYPRSLEGIRIYEDINMVVDGEPFEKKRTWKERLFSRPWRPLKTHRTIIPKVPSREIIMNKTTMEVFCHPSMRLEIEKAGAKMQ